MPLAYGLAALRLGLDDPRLVDIVYSLLLSTDCGVVVVVVGEGTSVELTRKELYMVRDVGV